MAMPDLSQSPDLDFAALDLNFEAFRELARNPHLDAHGKIGFPTAYREGYEPAIFEDIVAKLPRLRSEKGLTVADIGAGCAGLPRMLTDLCVRQGHRLILVDSAEMLDMLPDVEGVTCKVAGAFPACSPALRNAAPDGVDALICYSVLHYMFLDTNVFDVVDATVDMLAPRGRALYGDIPNLSKRRRLFASPTGKAVHRAHTGRDEDPPLDLDQPLQGRIDDGVLSGMIHRAQTAGCDAYLLPQDDRLPMANRRDDLLIARP